MTSRAALVSLAIALSGCARYPNSDYEISAREYSELRDSAEYSTDRAKFLAGLLADGKITRAEMGRYYDYEQAEYDRQQAANIAFAKAAIRAAAIRAQTHPSNSGEAE